MDTCLLVDIASGDPVFAKDSALLLDDKRDAGVVISPVSYVELAPMFTGDVAGQDLFLAWIGVVNTGVWHYAATLAAHAAWHRHVKAKRSGHAGKCPIADVLIGAFACGFDGLLPRNPNDFRVTFPGLAIVCP